MLRATFIDELSYMTLKPEQCNAFFRLMDQRYNRASTVITSNLLCGAPHKRFNGLHIVMRTLSSTETQFLHFLRIY
jgi:DNA replication protein DnaC